MPIGRSNSVSAINKSSDAACSPLSRCASVPLIAQRLERVEQAPSTERPAIPSASDDKNECASANTTLHAVVNKPSLPKPPNNLACLTIQEQQQWIESVKKAASSLSKAVDFILSHAGKLKPEVFENFATSVLNSVEMVVVHADEVLIEKFDGLTEPQQEFLTQKIIHDNSNVTDIHPSKIFQIIYLGNQGAKAQSLVTGFLERKESLSGNSFQQFMDILHYGKLAQSWKKELLRLLNSSKSNRGEAWNLPPHAPTLPTGSTARGGPARRRYGYLLEM